MSATGTVTCLFSGKLLLDIAEVAAQDASGEGRWYPLVGVKSGQILLTADFLPYGVDPDSGAAAKAGAAAKRLRDNLQAGGGNKSGEPLLTRADSKDRLGGGAAGLAAGLAAAGGAADGATPGLGGSLGGSGKNPLEGFKGDLHIDLVKGRNLVKADIMGKSDPYAVLKFGRQKEKTNTIKNTLEPQWDFSTDFKVPDGDANSLREAIMSLTSRL